MAQPSLLWALTGADGPILGPGFVQAPPACIPQCRSCKNDLKVPAAQNQLGPAFDGREEGGVEKMLLIEQDGRTKCPKTHSSKVREDGEWLPAMLEPQK